MIGDEVRFARCFRYGAESVYVEMETPIPTNSLSLGLGEILWDMLPGGRQLGGAPANFAYHAHALGAEARPVTRVGNDQNGRDILTRLEVLGLPTACVQLDDAAPTGTVSVEMLSGGEHRFTIHENVAWDRLEATVESMALASRADVVCFGTLAQRCDQSREAIQTIVREVPRHGLRILDINLRQHYFTRRVVEESLFIANVLKINDEELRVAAEMFGLSGCTTDQLAQLADRYELNLVALTRDGRGSVLYADGRTADVPGAPVAIVDTIGAGDAFTAAMALGWLAGWDLDEINRSANAVASFVCTQSGATPTMPPDLTLPFTSGQ